MEIATAIINVAIGLFFMTLFVYFGMLSLKINSHHGFCDRCGVSLRGLRETHIETNRLEVRIFCRPCWEQYRHAVEQKMADGGYVYIPPNQKNRL